MDLKDFIAVKQLCEKNVEKLQDNLRNFTRDSNILYKVLDERWVNVDKGDRALIGLHDILLSTMSIMNENVIKWNMQINLNKLGPYVGNGDEPLPLNDTLTHTNKHGIEVENVLDERPQRLPTIEKIKDSAPLVRDVESALPRVKPVADRLSLSTRSSWLIKPDEEVPKPQPKAIPAPPPAPAQPQDAAHAAMLPICPRKRVLKPPLGGKRTTSSEIYQQIVKNTAAFPEGSVINAAVMHLNIVDNCFFVGKWDAQPLQRVLQGKILLNELDQLPNFGEIFAVYDCNEQIVPRVIINDYADGGGYDAYLIDYGEHIHMNGEESIFALPDDIRQLPAEAIRCFFREGDVASMMKFRFKSVNLRVLQNSGEDLIVEVAEGDAKNCRISEITDKSAASDYIPTERNGQAKREDPQPSKEPSKGPQLSETVHTNPDQSKAVQEGAQSSEDWSYEGPQLSEADMAMLNEIDEGTSDPLKAVLGFRPRDQQRICRHYDPKLNGCFKGANCRLVHEPFAPHGATKDVEVAEALPETMFDTPLSRELGSTVRMLITYVSSTTEVYGQFVDGSPPLVWSKNDVLGAKSQFKHKPHLLDIVLARYNDGCYYRAQVIEESEGDYKIFYVDYGNTEFVPLSALVPCGDVDSLRPHRAVGCYIEGVAHKSSLSPKKAAECMEYLKSKILNVEEDVMLVSRLHDSFQIRFLGDNAKLFEQMLKRGYAQPEEDGPKPFE
ncbi:uncharacterized protein LOC111078504 [Drosophila obscura]|uniref:uncharacterized protein LOC111078504 n=1 Tax=Drosophila obscura TaxID=7282 RepID=UPI001BB28703|nr:uncharacterized protein LOC111078504 [Drosophila obscura]